LEYDGLDGWLESGHGWNRRITDKRFADYTNTDGTGSEASDLVHYGHGLHSYLILVSE